MAPVLRGEENGDWQQRLAQIVELVQEMSHQTDPQEMVRSYGERVRLLLPSDRRISLSRRGLTAPKYRITRSTTWAESINPWKEKNRLPLFEGGLIAKLIYGDQPQIIDNLDVSEDDPAAEYLSGHRSLVAIPMFDQGVALNTDGITEASNPEGKLFGTDRLDHELENCSLQASALLESVLRAVDDFANGNRADDDRTLIVARVS